MNCVTFASDDQEVDFRSQEIKRILIVRSLFRMGDVILATPAILLFRRNFPLAKIDFVGSKISRALFENLPIDGHFEVSKNFPRVSWSYAWLLKKIRDMKYDLAFDASGSSSALGSFIVGLSGAPLRVGVRGKWDRWFNIRLDRPDTVSKYHSLPKLIGSLGLKSGLVYPQLRLSFREIECGKARMRKQFCDANAVIVGIFAGGRKSRGKRWDKENFLQLAIRLSDLAVQPVMFVGPEEKDLLAYFERELKGKVPAIFEPDIRAFASLVANCRLFVACDSGPVHLACAVRVRTIAIFLKDDVDRWSPPLDLGRVVHCQRATPVDAVLEACHHELRCLN
jgi:ADP-heptose:LPS heptosyltransferase